MQTSTWASSTSCLPYNEPTTQTNPPIQVPSTCFAGVAAGCVVDPEVEMWPAMGVWNMPAVGGSLYSASNCMPDSGPDHIIAFPPSCQSVMTASGGYISWKYSCVTGSSAYIQYQEFNSRTCSGTPILNTYYNNAPINTCLPYSEPNSAAFRAFYACQAKSIPGVVVLPYGVTTTGFLSGGSVGSLIVGGLAAVVLGAFFCLGCSVSLIYYYCYIYLPRRRDLLAASRSKV